MARIEWAAMLRVWEGCRAVGEAARVKNGAGKLEVLGRKIWADDCGRRLCAFRGEKAGASAQCAAVVFRVAGSTRRAGSELLFLCPQCL